jgi:hypothetical protein
MKPYGFLILFFIGAVGFILLEDLMLYLEYSVVMLNDPLAEIAYRTMFFCSLGSLLVSIVAIFRARALCCEANIKNEHSHIVTCKEEKNP